MVMCFSDANTIADSLQKDLATSLGRIAYYRCGQMFPLKPQSPRLITSSTIFNTAELDFRQIYLVNETMD